MGELAVIQSTDRYVVVDKPAWLLSVPGKGPQKQDCVASRIAGMFPHARGPLIVHRLDMETSGLMVLGLDGDAQRELSGQFEERMTEKAYIALLGAMDTPGEGTAEAELGTPSGTISLPLRPDIDNRPIQIVDHVHGREAITHWRILAREIDRVRVLFEPVTGRTHQIRVHAAAGLRAPIIGDALYGGEPADRLMLHATSLSFLEPGSRTRVRFESRPPF